MHSFVSVLLFRTRSKTPDMLVVHQQERQHIAGGDEESDPEGMFLPPSPKEEEVSRTRPGSLTPFKNHHACWDCVWRLQQAGLIQQLFVFLLYLHGHFCAQ